PAIVQVQVKFSVRAIGGALPGNREEPGFSIGESETFGIEQRLIRSISRDGPLQGFVTLQPLVVDTGEHWSQRGNFIHDLGGMLIAPIAAQTVGDVLDNLPIRFTASERFEHFVEALNATLGASEGTLLLQARRAGQHNIRVTARVAEKDVLHDEKIKLLEP